MFQNSYPTRSLLCTSLVVLLNGASTVMQRGVDAQVDPLVEFVVAFDCRLTHQGFQTHCSYSHMGNPGKESLIAVFARLKDQKIVVPIARDWLWFQPICHGS